MCRVMPRHAAVLATNWQREGDTSPGRYAPSGAQRLQAGRSGLVARGRDGGPRAARGEWPRAAGVREGRACELRRLRRLCGARNYAEPLAKLVVAVHVDPL